MSLQPQGSKTKKILMIAHAFPPFRSVGHSIRAVKFIKFLPMLGWLPIALTIDDKMEYETMLKVGSESLLSEIHPQVKIYRTTAGEPSLNFLDREKILGQKNWLMGIIVKIFGGVRRWTFRNIFWPDRTITWLPFALIRGWQIVRGEGVDIIFATCPPHSVVLLGAALKLLTGKPLVLDFRDDWIDTPRYNSKPALIRMIERGLERWAVKTANRVVLVTEWSKKAFMQRYPSESAGKFILISNGCDLEEFTILKSTMVPRNAKFTIVHAGSFNDSKNWARSPVALFQAVHNILQEQPELSEHLTLAFTGSLPERQKELVKELGLSNVVEELGFLPRDKWLTCMKQADLLLVINYDGFSTLIPGKIYEYWAVGGPPILLVSCDGAATDFVKYHNLGFTVDYNDVEGMCQTILNVYRQSKTTMASRLSTTGIEAYDRQILTQKLAAVLSEIDLDHSQKVHG